MGPVKGNAKVDAVESSWMRYLIRYMVVSVNETWVVIVGCGTETGVADVQIDALVSASDGGSAGASGTREADVEVPCPDPHNSPAFHQVGCPREKRRWLWHDNPVHRLGVYSSLHNRSG